MTGSCNFALTPCLKVFVMTVPEFPFHLEALINAAPLQLKTALCAVVHYDQQLYQSLHVALEAVTELSERNAMLTAELEKERRARQECTKASLSIATARAEALQADLARMKNELTLAHSKMLFSQKSMEQLLVMADGDYERATRLLAETAAALKGRPTQGQSHRWDDLPEVARQMRAALLAAGGASPR